MQRLFSCLCVCVSAFFAGCGHDGGQDHSGGGNSGTDVNSMPSSCVIDSDCNGMGICEAKQCLKTCSTRGDKICGKGTACDGKLCRPVVDCPAITLSNGGAYSGKKCIKVHSHTPNLGWAKVFNGDLTFDETFVKESKSKFDSLTGNDFTSPNYVLQLKNSSFNKGFAWGITVYAGMQFLKGTLNYMNSVMQCFKPEGSEANSDAYKIDLNFTSVANLTNICDMKFGKEGTIREALKNDIGDTFCPEGKCNISNINRYKEQMIHDQCRQTKNMLAQGSTLADGLGSIFSADNDSLNLSDVLLETINTAFDSELVACDSDPKNCPTAETLANDLADGFLAQCNIAIGGILYSSLGRMFTSNQTDNFELPFCLQSDALKSCLVNTTIISLNLLNEKIASGTSVASILEYVDPEYFWLTGESYIPISILTKNDILSQNDYIMAFEYKTQDAIFSAKLTGEVEVEGYPDYAMISEDQALDDHKYSSILSYKERGGSKTGAFVYRRNFAGSQPPKAICPDGVCSVNIYAKATQTDKDKDGMKCGGITFIIKNLSGYVVLKDGDYVE